MATEKNFNQTGTVTKLFVKNGTSKNGCPWRLTTIGIKYTYNKKTTFLYVNSFNIKEGLPIDINDTVIIKGGIIYNNYYKKDGTFVTSYVVDGNYANIINDTKHIVLQEESDVKEISDDTDSDNVPF